VVCEARSLGSNAEVRKGVPWSEDGWEGSSWCELGAALLGYE
jgi:hypothetical protein